MPAFIHSINFRTAGISSHDYEELQAGICEREEWERKNEFYGIPRHYSHPLVEDKTAIPGAFIGCHARGIVDPEDYIPRQSGHVGNTTWNPQLPKEPESDDA